jgi:hypothetical protein
MVNPMTRTMASSILALAVLLGATRSEAADDEFLGPEYPLEVRISYPAGLFQWLDSLANTSAGKTIPIHRQEFVRRWGKPTAADNALLLKFRRARVAHHAATRNASALLGIFCSERDVKAALAAARKDLSPDEASDLAEALAGLTPKFDALWDDGAVPKAFVKRVGDDPQRAELATLLARIAAFFDVDPKALPRPHLVLVPVPEGWGTHAQAVGRQLLLEIRAGDGLPEQAAVIVHENTHFLFQAMPQARRAELAAAAKALHESGETAWTTLQEALPTAFGQGIADRIVRPAQWSRRNPWYHDPEVDAYAKSLHAAANHALAGDGRFDDVFLRRAVQAWLDRGKRRGPKMRGMEAAPRVEP